MPFCVARSEYQLHDLGGDGQPVCRAAGGPQDVVLGEQAVGEHVCGADATGECDGFCGQGARPGSCRVAPSAAAVWPGPPVTRASEPVHGALAERGVGLFQRGHQVCAGHGETGADPVHPEGHGCHQMRIVRMLPGFAEQVPGAVGVTGAQPGVSLSGQQSDEIPGGYPDAGNREPGAGQVRGGLVEGIPAAVLIRRRPRPLDHQPGFGLRQCRAVVAGQFGREDRAAPSAPLFQRPGDPVMQPGSLPGGQRGVDRLADQIMGEGRF